MSPKSEAALRFIKFGVVGCTGLVVNFIIFEVSLATIFSPFEIDARIVLSNALGIVISIFTNFLLNDNWTWGDRDKVSFKTRLFRYYSSASVAGGIQLAVTWGSYKLLWKFLPMTFWDHDWGPSFGLLTGIACGMFVNFLASHFWAFKETE